MSSPSQKGLGFERRIYRILVEAGYEVEWRTGEFSLSILLNGYCISSTLPLGRKISELKAHRGHNPWIIISSVVSEVTLPRGVNSGFGKHSGVYIHIDSRIRRSRQWGSRVWWIGYIKTLWYDNLLVVNVLLRCRQSRRWGSRAWWIGYIDHWIESASRPQLMLWTFFNWFLTMMIHLLINIS